MTQRPNLAIWEGFPEEGIFELRGESSSGTGKIGTWGCEWPCSPLSGKSPPAMRVKEAKYEMKRGP